MKNINKYDNNKINSLMYMVLIIFSSRAIFNGIAYSNILETTKQDTWISFIIGTILGLIFIVLIKNTKNNKINNIIFLIFTSFNLITILNDFITFLNIKYLFETPNILIALLLVIPMFYILNKGIEVIGRTSLFMFYITIIIFIINSITLINYIDFNNLKPMFTTSLNNIFISSLKYFIYTINPVILINSLPRNKDDKHYLIIGYIISSLSLFIILIYTTTIYNYNYLSLFNYPVYFILKKIEYNFISNAENILSIIFIIDYFFTSIVYFYIIKKNISFLIKKHTDVIFIIYSIAIILISIFLYKDILTIDFLKQHLYLIISSIFIIIYTIRAIKKGHKSF